MVKSQEIFEKDLASDAFKAGCVGGRWGVFEDTIRPPGAAAIAWPNVVIWISAAPRAKSPDRYNLYFDLEGYPGAAPTAYCWDPVTRIVLVDAQWPRSRDPAELTFRQGWLPGGSPALYAPWDRLSQAGHGDWGNLVGQMWNPEKHTIVDYLRLSNDLLLSDHYTGTYEANNP